ncbi:hypothetical protein H2136_20155 [Aeromonas hydrophila]|uniref:Uncharacterized protein n=1 Tax=Aeromonas hydrophila TaxID=644 RepID=A0A926FNZ0_AERHY|nr:hypothetical protein [Aeromonas hydrophila]
MTFTVWEVGKNLFPSALSIPPPPGQCRRLGAGCQRAIILDSFITGIDNMGVMVDTFLDDRRVGPVACHPRLTSSVSGPTPHAHQG